MSQKNNSLGKAWAIIDKLLVGSLALLQIREYFASTDTATAFIKKYLESSGDTIKRLPCNDCDENCDNEKWIKRLSDDSIVKVCPSYPNRCEYLSIDDITFYRTGASFFRSIASAMQLQNIPITFDNNELVYIGDWNTANYFATVYVSKITIPKFFEAAVSNLLAENPDRDNNEKIVVIVPRTEIATTQTNELLQKDRSKCFCFDELFDLSGTGEIILKSTAFNLFSIVDMAKLVNQRVKFIECKEIAEKTFWYINGQLSAFKRGKDSDHFKVIDLLAKYYNQGVSWVSHDTIIKELDWDDSKYWGCKENNYRRQGSKTISVLRSELGIEIAYNKVKGYKITGNLSSPKTVPN